MTPHSSRYLLDVQLPRRERPAPVHFRPAVATTSTPQSRLILRYPYQTDGNYAYFYFESAGRLVSTFTGQPADDTMLIPLLMLYRHGFELLLKDSIRELAKLRRVYLGHGDPDVRSAKIDARLKDELGHRLYPLLNEMKSQWAALDVSETLPPSVERAIAMLNEVDRAGLSFRYADPSRKTTDRLDFATLIKILEEAKDDLYSAMDWITEGFANMPTIDDVRGDYY